MRSTEVVALSVLLVTVACQEGGPTSPVQPAALVVVSGDLQVGIVGRPLTDSLVVKVSALDGSPVANAVVHFVVSGGHGAVVRDSVLTNSTGLCADQWRLGTRTTDSQTVAAFVLQANRDTLRATFRATAHPDTADTLVLVSGDSQEALFGARVRDSLVVRVLDQFGNPVPGWPIRWSVTLGGGTISPNVVLADTAGLAKAAWTLGGVVFNASEALDTVGFHHAAFGATAGRIIWRNAKGTWTFSSPAIGPDGTVYYGARDSTLRAVRPDGTLRWSYHVAEGILDDGPSVGAGGDVYFATYPGAAVYALSPQGGLKWRFHAATPVRSTLPVGADGTVYALSLEGLYAIDSSGAQRWFRSIPGASDDSPVIGPDGAIYVPAATKGRLYALTPADSLRWVVSFPGDTFNNDLGTPSVGPDGTVYLTAQDKQLYAVDSLGVVKWSVPVGTLPMAAKGAPAVSASGEIYVSGFGGLWAVSSSGSILWNTAAFSTQPVLSTPVLAADGTIYFADADAVLFALDHSGALLWSQAIGGQIVASPAIGQDGTVYVGSSSTGLVAIQGSSPLATGGWPMFMHDVTHSGRQP